MPAKRAAAAEPGEPIFDGGYVCVRCGKRHDQEQVESWGVNGIGAGYGPTPVCTALVGPDRKPIAEGDGTTPGQVCRGQLTWRDA